MRLRTLLAASVLGAVLSTGVATAAPADGGAAYVALGDSGAATTGIRNLDLRAPIQCLRSTTNTPSQVALSLGLRLDDRTCSSARMPNLTVAQGPGTTPQFDALGPRTKLVTVHIGANDAEFTRHIAPCHFAALTGGSCPPDPAWDDAIAAVAAPFGAALQQISRLAPNATVFVDGWPLYLRDGGCAAMVALAPEDARYIQSKFDALSAVVAREAAAHGAIYVDTKAAAAGRDMCAPPGVRWFEPVLADQTLLPYHPTVEGMRGVADVIVAAVRAAGVG